jgi:hypothetical protein
MRGECTVLAVEEDVALERGWAIEPNLLVMVCRELNYAITTGRVFCVGGRAYIEVTKVQSNGERSLGGIYLCSDLASARGTVRHEGARGHRPDRMSLLSSLE